MPANLYVHFPFCRRKCSYCALYSRVGVSDERRREYVADIARQIAERAEGVFSTVYFGGGTPALCDLKPVFESLAPHLGGETEFTVELHPEDVTPELLARLGGGGVNRISLGVQSLDDSVLAAMGRGYSFSDAERAFALVKGTFDNAGIDLIVGYPGETAALIPRHARLAKWGLRHCSAYALQNERGLEGVADDETVMNRIGIVASFLKDIGLERYEISNYAVPGFECRHNLAVWRGEDYLGLGEGACGRIGRLRTGFKNETLSEEEDKKERTIFRLRTREGLDAAAHPEWRGKLDAFVAEGLLRRNGDVYFLTSRGAEVCDSILTAIV